MATTPIDYTQVHAHPQYEARADRLGYDKDGNYQEPCECCGRALRNRTHWAFTKYGGEWLDAHKAVELCEDGTADAEAMVCWLPIGSDCAKKIRAAGVMTGKLVDGCIIPFKAAS